MKLLKSEFGLRYTLKVIGLGFLSYIRGPWTLGRVFSLLETQETETRTQKVVCIAADPVARLTAPLLPPWVDPQPPVQEPLGLTLCKPSSDASAESLSWTACYTYNILQSSKSMTLASSMFQAP